MHSIDFPGKPSKVIALNMFMNVTILRITLCHECYYTTHHFTIELAISGPFSLLLSELLETKSRSKTAFFFYILFISHITQERLDAQ